MSGGWRLEAVASEAVANIRMSVGRSILILVGVGGMFGALALAELSFTSAVKAEAGRYDVAGGTIAVIDGPSGLSATRCESLRWRDGVHLAGGVRRGSQVSSANSPGVFFERWEVTGDLARLWDPEASGVASPGYIFGTAAATELGAAPGTLVPLGGEPQPVAAVVDPSARNEFAARAVLDPVAPAGRLDQCWVEFERTSYDAGLAWLPAHFAADDGNVRPAISAGEFSVDPVEMLRSRPQRFGWVPAGIVATVLFALTAVFRRSEAALYQAFGLSRLGSYVMHQVEAGLLIAVALAAGLLWAVTVHAFVTGIPSFDQVLVATRTASLGALVALAAAPAIATVAGIGSVASLLKER